MKLSPLTIILIGFSILLMALSFGFFQHWLPNTTEAGYYTEYANKLEEEGNKLPKAKQRLAMAEDRVDKMAEQWRAVVATKTPTSDLGNRGIGINVDGWQLVVDSKKFRDNIQRAVNAQMLKGGIKVIGNGPQVPIPTDSATEILASFYNYPAIAFPVVILDLGQITVEGTYDQIMENVRSWKNMPHYLAVADGLSLAGNSPKLRGTYSVSIVGYVRGTQVFPTVPEGAAPSGAGGGAGGPGGFGGPGGPGGFGGPGGPGGRGGPGLGVPGRGGPGGPGAGGPSAAGMAGAR